MDIKDQLKDIPIDQMVNFLFYVHNRGITDIENRNKRGRR